MKKVYLVIGVIVLLIFGLLFLRFVFGGDEDTWIKDERGVWIRHGNPYEISQDVLGRKTSYFIEIDKEGRVVRIG